MEDFIYWLALQERHWLISAKKVERAFHELGSLEELWNSSNSYLRELGLDDYAISEFYRYKKRVNLEEFSRQLNILRQKQIKLIRCVNNEYPILLKSATMKLEGPPLLIFDKGSLLDFNNCIAIVGTRMSSYYGHMMARRLSRSLASKGYTIVSGLARGVDTEAHCGALEVPKGKTIAVLAWMDPIYPPGER